MVSGGGAGGQLVGPQVGGLLRKQVSQVRLISGLENSRHRHRRTGRRTCDAGRNTRRRGAGRTWRLTWRTSLRRRRTTGWRRSNGDRLSGRRSWATRWRRAASWSSNTVHCQRCAELTLCLFETCTHVTVVLPPTGHEVQVTSPAGLEQVVTVEMLVTGLQVSHSAQVLVAAAGVLPSPRGLTGLALAMMLSYRKHQAFSACT